MPEQAAKVRDERLTVNEVAESAAVHPVTVRKWLCKGILPFTKTKTGRVRIKAEDLRAFLALE